jgi:eukaryotic-like serine/threonine-protein kinase
MPCTTPRLIAPQLTSGTEPPASASIFTETMLGEQTQRVAVAALVAAGLWAYGLAMDGYIRPVTLGVPVQPTTVIIEVASIVIALAMFALVRLAPTAPQTKIDAGLGFFAVNAFAVALLNSWAQSPADTVKPLSWNTVVVLVSAMILPTTPQRMLVSALVAASMDPLAVWIRHLRGLDTPGVIQTFVIFAPNYACALVATLPSRALTRLSRRLRQVQDMGSYHLVERLGRGGMGEVWRARHRLLARSAAIKLVRPELLGAANEVEAQSMLRRFEREAQATAALSSPHTIRVFDFGVTGDRTFYYAMELLDGRDVESLVREFGPLPAERALFLLRQVCHSLADAHARGLVHRDITPSNIYVCRMGLDFDFIKVLDFGLVTYNDREAAQKTLLTGQQIATGTPAFMAPEILDGDVDERTDVYALGCVAYYLLTGELVFEGESPIKLFIQHLQATPLKPSERTEMPIPADVEALVMACLEKDPERRPQDAAEVLRRIDQCRTGRAWNNDAARDWWELNLSELAGRIDLDESRFETVAVAV